MNREPHTPPRRQFMHPMSPIRDKLPVMSSETPNSYLPSQPLLEDWMIPQSQPDNAPFFASPTNDAFQQEGFMPASRALPQDDENFRPWESKSYETYVEPGRDTTLSWMIPPSPSHPAQAERGYSSGKTQTLRRQKRPKARKRRIPIWMALVSIIVVVVIVLSQGNGVVGAWTADEFRAIAGPVAAAQVEALYLNAQNTTYNWEYQLGFHHVAAPFQAKSTVIKSAKPAKTTLKPMPLTTMKALISPALDGEGVWNIQEAAPHTYSYLPLDAKAFIRPDPTVPYAVVSLLQFDARFMRLHIVSGTQEPGGTLGAYGAGIIPQGDQEGNTLLATLNGGFKYADGAFGLMTDGKVFVPPQQNAATIAITKSGKLIIGAWGTDPRLNNNNNDLAAWRQNAGLLINNGEISTLAKDGAAWGGTILNSEYTWRSGLGVTAEGNLVYAAGNALLPETLGKALKAAGAVMAMETDINPFWARAFLYQQDTNGAWTISKLSTDMQGTGKEYLTANQRDFFYLTRYTPTKITQ